MKKMYRVFMDVRAKNKEDAIEEVAKAYETNTIACLFRVQENPFTDEEEGTVLEAARVAMADAEAYECIADKLDISDKEMKNLQQKIEAITNR